MWFLPPKQNKRGIIYNNYTCPCPGGGQDNRVSVLSSHDDILHRYTNLSNFPEKIHVICFDVYMAPDRSLFGSWAGKKITCQIMQQILSN